MLEEQVSTIPDFLKAVLNFRDCCFPSDYFPDIWYRGLNDNGLSLQPGAYWRKQCDENSLVLSFRSMVPSYISREPIDDWEWYYLMQHYGLPTRLLDWTESPLVALFFALDNEAPGKTPSIWMMDPLALNRIAHGSDINWIFTPLGIEVSETRFWLPPHCGRDKQVLAFDGSALFKDNSKPIAIFPKRYNPRIVAQRGVFTIHGCEETPIERLFESASDQYKDRLARITIEPSNRKRLIKDLRTLGINRTSLFPEPQSVAEDLKQIYDVC